MASSVSLFSEWEICVSKATLQPGEVVEHIIDGEDFIYLDRGARRVFRSEDVPFDVVVTRFYDHSYARQEDYKYGPHERDMVLEEGPVVDGAKLISYETPLEAERSIGGAYVEIHKPGEPVEKGILWAMQEFPLPIDVGSETWGVDLRRKRWDVPFAIRLDDFTRELHPRTNQPSHFSSDVTLIEDGAKRPIKIRMNEPLRHKGYTLYQASFGPKDAKPGQELYSVLAVADNPADRIPEISCWIIAIGLLWHFVTKLVLFILRQSKARGASS